MANGVAASEAGADVAAPKPATGAAGHVAGRHALPGQRRQLVCGHRATEGGAACPGVTGFMEPDGECHIFRIRFNPITGRGTILCPFGHTWEVRPKGGRPERPAAKAATD